LVDQDNGNGQLEDPQGSDTGMLTGGVPQDSESSLQSSPMSG